MTTGTSKFGFETDQDREREQLMKSQAEKALEARKRARERKAADLARLLDPVMREILADFLSAYEEERPNVTWDGEKTWSLDYESGPIDDWSLKVSAQAHNEPVCLELRTPAEGRRRFHSLGDLLVAPGAIARLEEVLLEVTGLQVRNTGYGTPPGPTRRR